MMKTTASATNTSETQKHLVTKKKMRAILQPRDTIYVVYGDWGSKKKKK